MEATDKLTEAAESLLAPMEPEETVEAEEVETTEPEEAEAETDDVEETDEVEAEDDAEDAEAEEEASDEDEENDDGQKELPQTLKVKVDGEEVEVTLDDLKRSYSGQAYIQKQMQEAAATRKQLQAETQALQAEQRKFLEFAQTVQQQGIVAPPEAPDVSMAETDPLGYMQARAKYDQQMQAYQEQQAQVQNMRRQMTEAEQRAAVETLQAQARILAETIPEFADETKRPEFNKRIVKTGTEYGYSEDELLTVTDARAIRVLNDAMKYRELQAQRAAAKKKPEPPKNVKPSARRTEPPQLVRSKQLKQARKSGKLSDFANLLLE